MQPAMFELSTHNDRDTIYMPGSGLQITVYNLALEYFYPHPDKLQLYTDNHGAPLAFEVETDPDGHDEQIAAALKWYAQLIDQPQMDLSPINPMPAPMLRVVR